MTSKSIWQRRAILMAAVGLMVAVPTVIALRDSDDGSGATSDEASVPRLGPVVRDAGVGVRYQVAEGWRRDNRASAISLRSPERDAQIVIASPAPAAEAAGVLDEAIAAVRSGYQNVDIRRGSGRRIGGLKAKGAVATVRTRAGDRLRILVAVARGKRRAHLVEVFTASDASGASLREAQVTLNSVGFLS